MGHYPTSLWNICGIIQNYCFPAFMELHSHEEAAQAHQPKENLILSDCVSGPQCVLINMQRLHSTL